MYCSSCGTAVRSDARFCAVCGSPISPLQVATAQSQEIATRFCPSCGLVGPASAGYCTFCGGCTHCGHAGAHAPHLQPAGTPYADFGSRFSAHILIDGAVVFGIFALAGMLAGVLGDAAGLFGVAAWFSYAWWGNATGQSLGKKAVGIRVVRADTASAPGWRRGLARTIGYLFSWMFFWLGYLWAAWDSRHQAWHDKFAGTVVIRDDPTSNLFAPQARG